MNNSSCISLNDLLIKEVNSCFCCDCDKYCQFFVDGHIYRLCANCLKLKKVIKFFKDKFGLDIRRMGEK